MNMKGLSRIISWATPFGLLLLYGTAFAGGWHHGGGHHGAHGTPELDPGMIVEGLGILAGSVLLLTERVRRR
jgi:hypothetical protein